MEAVLVSVLGLTTWARSCSVCGVAWTTVPTVQMPVALLYDPWLGLADTKLSPAGSRSVICTLVAVLGPRSLAWMVKVIVSPTLGMALLTLLATARSACWGVSVALALLLAALGSN